jgi:hypothetical protein
MEAEKFSISISPEVLSTDIFPLVYTAKTFYDLPVNGVPTNSTPFTATTQNFSVYSGMSQILSGGTNGTSLLTGLTIPVMFTQDYNDIGYYSEFDGLIAQKDIVTNFLVSGDNLNNLFSITLYNTSGDFTTSFLDFTTFSVDWNDGSSIQTMTGLSQNHIYQNSGSYVITLSGANPWGVTTISKPLTIPFTNAGVPNPNGTITFTPSGGSWNGVQLTLNYILPLDANNNLSYQSSSNWTQVPFVVSGYTKSKIQDLRRYGPNPYTVGYVFSKNGQFYGKIDSINNGITGYTIENINYFDLPDGKTFYIVSSNGLTQNDLDPTIITKNEQLLDFVMAPQVQTDIYVERGKYSAFESIERLGEVDNMGDLERYGYGFFQINIT